jgi:hypothetical protein
MYWRWRVSCQKELPGPLPLPKWPSRNYYKDLGYVLSYFVPYVTHQKAVTQKNKLKGKNVKDKNRFNKLLAPSFGLQDPIGI